MKKISRCSTTQKLPENSSWMLIIWQQIDQQELPRSREISCPQIPGHLRSMNCNTVERDHSEHLPNVPWGSLKNLVKCLLKHRIGSLMSDIAQPNMFLFGVTEIVRVLNFKNFSKGIWPLKLDGKNCVHFKGASTRGHYITNSNTAILKRKSLKITVHLYCLIPPKLGMTPVNRGESDPPSFSFTVPNFTVVWLRNPLGRTSSCNWWREIIAHLLLSKGVFFQNMLVWCLEEATKNITHPKMFDFQSCYFGGMVNPFITGSDLELALGFDQHILGS